MTLFLLLSLTKDWSQTRIFKSAVHSDHFLTAFTCCVIQATKSVSDTELKKWLCLRKSYRFYLWQFHKAICIFLFRAIQIFLFWRVLRVTCRYRTLHCVLRNPYVLRRLQNRKWAHLKCFGFSNELEGPWEMMCPLIFTGAFILSYQRCSQSSAMLW